MIERVTNYLKLRHEFHDRGMTDEERMKFFRDFILWQQEGLDIEKYPCLFINFVVNGNMRLETVQMRREIMI